MMMMIETKKWAKKRAEKFGKNALLFVEPCNENNYIIKLSNLIHIKKNIPVVVEADKAEETLSFDVSLLGCLPEELETEPVLAT